MKRPACFASLCLVFVLSLLFWIRPPGVYQNEGISKKTVKAQGTLSDKYQKNGSFCLILSDARISRGDVFEKGKFNTIVKLGEEVRTYEDLPKTGCTVLVTGKMLPFLIRFLSPIMTPYCPFTMYATMSN